MGRLYAATGNYTLGLTALAGMEALAAVSVILIGRSFFATAKPVAALE